MGRPIGSAAISFVCVVGSVFLLPRSAAAASASDSAAAQALFDEAKALMEAGDFANACPKLVESHRIDPGVGTLLNLAKCYEDSGRLASAWTTYLEAASAARKEGDPREGPARELAAELRPRVSKIIISVPSAPPEGFTVKRDGEVVGSAQWGVPIAADAGEHSIEASAPGREPWAGVVSVDGEGVTVTVDVPELEAADIADLERDEAQQSNEPAPSGLGTQRVLALVSGGVGLVGVGVGSYFGLRAFSENEEAEKYCDGAACTDQRGVTASDASQTAGTISTIAFAVGGVGLAAGVTLWLTAPPNLTEDVAPASARLSLGPGMVRLSGSFE